MGVIQSQISVLSTQIAAVQNNIGQTEQKITAKEGEITQKQAEIDSQWGDFKKHMAAMQELRDGGSVAMLSAVNDLYELLTFNEVMQDISIKDTEIMDNMKAAKSALEADKVELEAQRKELTEPEGGAGYPELPDEGKAERAEQQHFCGAAFCTGCPEGPADGTGRY